ncbi:MAG TPA: winged helix-turn-helix transcriptional regulator [Anaerolineae bacterium]|nr:winged helix-turn-helix transcriptional regulator [Anaerolineae bacterium]
MTQFFQGIGRCQSFEDHRYAYSTGIIDRVIAEVLNLLPSTVSHHLTRLRKVGLVSVDSESYTNVYRLETNDRTHRIAIIFFRYEYFHPIVINLAMARHLIPTHAYSQSMKN